MTPLLTKWREKEGEFEKKFIQNPDKTFTDKEGYYFYPEDFKDFHRQSLIAIIEGEILRLEEDDSEIKKNPLYDIIGFKVGWGECIKQQISYHQSTLEGLKK